MKTGMAKTMGFTWGQDRSGLNDYAYNLEKYTRITAAGDA
jgi:hypothetical protein